MRSLHILFILVVVTWLGFPLRAQEAISIGTRHTLFSHVLNEAREYWVYVPATRPGEKEESYPVLYLLDGDSFFHSVVGFTRLFSTSKVSSLPPCIVVAVLNTNRTRDFTPTCSAARVTELSVRAINRKGWGRTILPFSDGGATTPQWNKTCR